MTAAAVTSFAPQAASAMTAAARDFLASLDASQRAEAMFPFAGDERFVWHYTPVPRNGLSLNAMQPDQRTAALDLVATGLSPRGWRQAQQIMALETILDEWERMQGLPLRWRRDPEEYHLSVFGQPGDDRWAWRVCGHHLLTHITVAAQAHLACVPLFFGANPAEVRHGPDKGLRILSAEEDLARGLLEQLTPDQRRVAIVDPQAPDDILTKNYRAIQPGMAPQGLALGDMAQASREQLVRLIRHYVERSAGEMAANAWRDIERAGLDPVTFAWAGPQEPGHGHYYAVVGSTFLIEYDNTQDGANHVHSVWRDFTNDFGGDVLAEHYAESAHHHDHE